MEIALYIGWIVLIASLGYLLLASFCVLKFKRRLSGACDPIEDTPGVTLYKPLHGMDYDLKQNLLGFCRQDYPAYQVIFGVSDANDPAISIVREVMAECPDVDTELVISSRINGDNPKVSNLINMDGLAKHTS